MRIRRKLATLLTVLGVSTTMVMVAPGVTTASTIYNPPWADMNCSWFTGSGMDGLDTRQSCLNAATVLTSAGYHSFQNTGGPSAATVMSGGYAQSDAIWALFGHSNAGFMTTYNSSTGQTVLSVRAGIGSSCTGNNACLDQFTTTQLGRIKLMIFGGCYTANAYNGLDASYKLPYQVSHYRGVDAAVGWTAETSWPHMDRWIQAFFQSTGTFFNSAVYAENQVYAMYGGYGGTDTSQWYGNWNLHVRPAGYGS
jgi:hypothetical protein